MAKTVFRPGEAKVVEDKVMLPLYKDYSPVVEEPEVVEEVYTGPTADDLRREAEAFKEQWEAEKNQMFAQEQVQAVEILKKADVCKGSSSGRRNSKKSGRCCFC